MLSGIIFQEVKNVVAVTAVNFLLTSASDCNCNTVVNNSGRSAIFRVQHAHGAAAGHAQLHQRIGALSQRRSGKGEHHASGQRRRYCTPDKFALFHGITSFFPSHFYGGGYVLQYLDYFTLYRILQANLRESP